MTNNSNVSKAGGSSAAGADNSSLHSSMLGSRVAAGGAAATVKSEALPQPGGGGTGQLSVKSGDTSGPAGSVQGARDKPPNGLQPRPFTFP